MNITITRFAIVAAALSASLLLGTPVLNAQNTSATTSGPAAGGPAGTPGGGGAQAFMQQMLERRDANIKVELKVSDDEWSVIKPLLDKVELAQFAFITSGNFGMGGRRPAGGPGGRHDRQQAGPGAFGRVDPAYTQGGQLTAQPRVWLGGQHQGNGHAGPPGDTRRCVSTPRP